MSFFTRWIDYFGNHRTTFGLGILIIVAHLIIAAERVYVYRNAGPWVVIARIGGQSLHLESVLVLLFILRRSISWLRARGLEWLLPLDRHVHFHKIMGWTICAYSVVHTIGHLANYANRSRKTGVPMIDLVFDANAGWVKGWVSPTGFAMLAILFIMGVFAHRSVRKSGHFELFYWTHLLFVAFFVLMILHGPNVWKWLVAPLCLYAMEVLYKVWYNCSDRGKTYVSSVLILPNQVLRLKIDRPPDFDFLAGDYVYLNIPQVAKMEWHPFTISSAPEDEEFLTLHIRVAGGWTSKLYEICQRDAERLVKEKSIQKLRSKLNPFRSRLTYAYRKTTGGRENLAFQPDSTLPPSTRAEAGISFGTPYRTTKEDAKEFAPPEMPILIDGPYGGCAVGVWKTPYVVLIAGGIGVTPFASLLQSLVNRYQSAMSPCPHCSKPCCTNVPASMGRMRHVDFIWVNRDLLSFQWFLELMLDLDREQAVGGSIMQQFLNIQLYQTEGKTLHESYKPCKSCSETLPGAPKVENDPPAMDSSVSIQIRKPPVGGQCPYCMLRQMNHLLHYGRPVWDEVFEEVAIRSAGRVTVFYCGPRGMGNEIRTKCRKYGFTFTKEIF